MSKARKRKKHIRLPEIAVAAKEVNDILLTRKGGKMKDKKRRDKDDDRIIEKMEDY